MIQFFASEYCNPKSLVLVIGTFEGIEYIKSLFTFINSDVIFVDTILGEFTDIVIKNDDLPFENHSFDLIINFNDFDIINFLKPNGRLLINKNVIGSIEKYTIRDKYFSVI
jgi:hypothetical protein